MFNFLKSSIRELKHVVWPTKDETKKYFIIVLSVLIIFGLYLFVASSIFSELLFFLKNNIGTNSVETNIPNIDFNSINVNTGAIDQTGSIINTGGLVNTGTIVE